MRFDLRLGSEIIGFSELKEAARRCVSGRFVPIKGERLKTNAAKLLLKGEPSEPEHRKSVP